jgi:hypothetical protein
MLDLGAASARTHKKRKMIVPFTDQIGHSRTLSARLDAMNHRAVLQRQVDSHVEGRDSSVALCFGGSGSTSILAKWPQWFICLSSWSGDMAVLAAPTKLILQANSAARGL